MDNFRIPDIYPANLMKTLTLKVDNIVKHDDGPVGYSFTVEDDTGLIINFDQFVSIHPLHFWKIILNASVGMARYRRMIKQDPLINGCVGLLPPGNRVLEYFIIDAYHRLMEALYKPVKHVNIVVKWPEKEGKRDAVKQ